MAASRQHVWTVLARGGAPALACLCCSFCTADPDVVFWTLAPATGTPRDGGGGARPEDGAAGPMTVDAEIHQHDGGTIPQLDAGLMPVPDWCLDGGGPEIATTGPDCEWPLFTLADGEIYDPLQRDLVSTDGGSISLFVRVDGSEHCGNETLAYYFDDEERPTKIVFCKQTCAVMTSVGHLIFGGLCEAIYGR